MYARALGEIAFSVDGVEAELAATSGIHRAIEVIKRTTEGRRGFLSRSCAGFALQSGIRPDPGCSSGKGR